MPVWNLSYDSTQLIMRPTVSEFAATLRRVGELLDEPHPIYVGAGRFAFTLSPDWRLLVSRDEAQRIRLDMVNSGHRRGSMWVTAHDDKRLAELVWAAESEIATRAV